MRLRDLIEDQAIDDARADAIASGADPSQVATGTDGVGNAAWQQALALGRRN